MNNKCLECKGKCCVGIIEVYESDTIYKDTDLTRPYTGFVYDRVMITKKNSQCIALENGICSIYEKRPEICRKFKIDSECCLDFKNNKKKRHECATSKCKLYLDL